jgi:hypothetical protein
MDALSDCSFKKMFRIDRETFDAIFICITPFVKKQRPLTAPEARFH